MEHAGSTGMDNRKPGYHHGNLRSALLEASIHILRDSGLESLTLREAARRAGVSQAAPYRHFHNKEALIAELVSEAYRKICSKMDQRFAQNDLSATDKFVEMGVVFFEFAQESPDYFNLLLNTDFKKIRNHPSLNRETMQNVDRGLSVANELIELGYFTGMTSHEVVALSWSVCLGFSTMIASGCSQLFGVNDARLKEILRLAFAGLLKKEVN